MLATLLNIQRLRASSNGTVETVRTAKLITAKSQAKARLKTLTQTLDQHLTRVRIMPARPAPSISIVAL